MAIRQRRFADHARLMLAMAAVASGALWVRLTTTVATGYDLPFDPVYGCAAWLGWLVPLAARHAADHALGASFAQAGTPLAHAPPPRRALLRLGCRA